MAYRDEMEAARRRVEALETELRRIAAEVGPREASDEVYAKVVALAEALESVQRELQRRRREHDTLWREAALAEIRRRELEHAQRRVEALTRTADRERQRADYAEIALMRTQMRLAIERARAQVTDPWAPSAIRARRDEVAAAAGGDALAGLPDDALRVQLERLALLVADVLWNPPTDPVADREALLATLRAAGHTLRPDGERRFLPEEGEPGLSITLGPLALRLAFERDGRRHAVTLADDGPLRFDAQRLEE